MKNILKASGSMLEIIATLKTLQAIFGESATLSTVAIKTRYNILENALQDQFGKDGEKCL